jgi:hypothetical protein
VTIGSGVTSIDNYAFAGYTSIASITSKAMVAPTIQNYTFEFLRGGRNGILYVPIGSSGYDTWMRNSQCYLGYYNWTKVEQ